VQKFTGKEERLKGKDLIPGTGCRVLGAGCWGKDNGEWYEVSGKTENLKSKIKPLKPHIMKLKLIKGKYFFILFGNNLPVEPGYHFLAGIGPYF
jgi:hypothetical protein